MTDGDKNFCASVGISTSLDTILATTLGSGSLKSNITESKNNHTTLKYFNSNKVKNFSEQSSKSSSGASLFSITNNNARQLPYHHFNQSQLPRLASSWNSNLNNARSSSVFSQVHLI